MVDRWSKNRTENRPGVQLNLPMLAPLPAKAVKQTLAWLDDRAEKKGEPTLREAADGIRLSGQGPELSELVRIWSSLLEDGKIILLRNSTPAQLPDSLMALEKPECWNDFRIRPRKRLSREKLDCLLALIGDFPGSGKAGDSDEVVDDIRRMIRSWKMELAECKTLCRRAGSPGENAILDCLYNIQKLSRIWRVDELLETVGKDEFRVLRERVQAIRVYGGVQILFWKSFQKAVVRLAGYEEELRTCDGFLAVRAELARLRENPEPWNVIDRIREMTSWMEEEMDQLDHERLKKARSSAMDEVDDMIADVYRRYPKETGRVEERRQALFSLRQIRKKLEMAVDRSAVETAMEEALR